jgi:glycosyltransferase involved in cell wall biosynthesis
MKILIYTEYFFPVPGGVQTIVVELARGLAEWTRSNPTAEAIEVTVVTRTREHMAEDELLPFRLVRAPGFWELVRLVREAEVVHLAGPVMLPLALAIFLRKPAVVEHHGFQVACPNGLLFYEPDQSPCPGHYMARRYEKCILCNSKTAGKRKSWMWLALTPLRRQLAQMCAINITPTDWLAEILKLKNSRTVHHGITRRADAPAIPATAPVFAFQGRLVSTKGVGLLLEAADQLRKANCEFELRIIGEGPEEGALKSRAARLNGRVRFLGHVPDDRLEAVLQEVSTVVMPSLGGEVFGLVAAENMLRGKLLIVSDIGALREVVGQTGVIVKTGDAESLATCMRAVLEDPSLPASLGQAARVRATQAFDVESMVRGHLSLYRAVLSHS